MARGPPHRTTSTLLPLFYVLLVAVILLGDISYANSEQEHDQGQPLLGEPHLIESPVVEGNVNIELKDFLRLHQSEERWMALLKNLTTSTPPPPPPRDYVVKSTSITGSATGPVAELKIAFVITILQDSQWASIPLLCSGSHIVKSYNIKRLTDAKEDKAAVQFSASDGYYTFYASQKGDYLIELEVREPIHGKSTRPNMSINFATELQSVTNLLEIRVPHGSFVSLTPTAYVEMMVEEKAEKKERNGEESKEEEEGTEDGVPAETLPHDYIARAYFPPTESLKIEWSVKETMEPKEPQQDGKKKQVPTTMRVQENILYDINDDGFITITASFYYDITLGKQNKFQIKYDDQIRILDVSGVAIDKWEIGYLKTLTGNPTDEGKVLYIYTDQPMDKDFRVKVIAEMPSAFDLKKGNTTAEVLLPTFTALDVRRENLVLAVSSSPFLEVTELKRDSGVVRVDPRELGPLGWQLGSGSRGRAILFSYTSSTSAVRILLDLTKHKDVAVLPAIIESATLQSTFVTDRILYHFYINLRNSQKQYLRVDIPDKEYEVWSTFVAGEPVKPSSDETGALLVPIKKDFRSSGRDNMFMVEVVYYAPAAKLEDQGEMQIRIPKLDIPITKFYLQLNMPTTHIFEKFEGADLQKMDSYSCPMPQPYEYQPQQPPQPYYQQQNSVYGASASAPMPQRAYAKKNYMQARGMAREAGGWEEEAKTFGREQQEDLEMMMMADGGGGGTPVGMMADDSTTFSVSSSASGGLDSGVLPVQIPALLVGDRFCFERMLVHEKGFLSFKASYVNKEKHNKSLVVWIHHAAHFCASQHAAGIFVVLLGAFSLTFLLWRCFGNRNPAKRE